MGFLDIFRTREDIPVREEKTEAEPVNDVLLRALLNNNIITKKMALTVPAVAAAIDLISGMVASMPVRLYEQNEKVEEITNDYRLSLLNADTGDTLNGYEWKKAMVTDYLLGRGGYSFIERNGNQIAGLYYVDDDFITVLKSPNPIYKSFKIFCYDEEFEPFQFIRLLRNTKDGMEGAGVIYELSKQLETAYQTLLYQLGLVKSGGNKRGFLKADRKLGQNEINLLKAAWRNLYMNNEENVVVLNNGLQFQEAANTSVEMQLNENKKTLNDEINNIFHINSDDFYQTFKSAIYPVVKAFEAALNSSLLLEKEKGKLFFEFDVKEILRVNIKERYEAYDMALKSGWKTVNEVRKAENENYIEGMDVLNVGLGAVLYDINTHQYYTPNTDTVGNPSDEPVGENTTDEAIQKVLIDKELDTDFEQSGNSSDG